MTAIPVITQQASASREVESAEALYSAVAMKRLEAQFHDIEFIESRASTMFTIGSAILPLTAGLLTTDGTTLHASAVAIWSLVGGFGCYLLLVVFFVWSYRFNRWDSRPDLSQWKEVTVGRSEHEMQRWLGDACVEAYGNNEPIVESKANKIGLALWCLAGEAACLTVAVLAPLWPLW